MKKIFLLSAFALTIIGAKAQVTFGVRAGLNIARASYSPAPQGITIGSKTGIQLGATAEYSISDNFSLESGLFYSGKGGRLTSPAQSITVPFAGTITIPEVKTTISVNYLEIPINAIYKIDAGKAKVLLNAGPYIAFGIGGTIKSEGGGQSQSESIKFGTSADSDVKGSDFGLNLGAGVLLAEKFTVGLQYGLGLSNISPQSQVTSKNGVFSLTVGYKFVK